MKNEEQEFTAFITKYALTSGIKKLTGKISANFPELFSAPNPGCYENCFHGEGKEWHRTWESALKRAESMRVKKIQALENQIERLKNLKFTEPK